MSAPLDWPDTPQAPAPAPQPWPGVPPAGPGTPPGWPAAHQPPPARTGIPAGLELLGYVGGTLVAVAGFALVARAWDGLPAAIQTAIPLASAAGLVAGGQLLRKVADPAADRLVGFLWFLSLGALGAGAALATRGSADDLRIAATGVATLGLAVPLWSLRTSHSSLTGVFAATATALTGALALADASWAVSGAAVIALGVAWIALGELAVLRPQPTVALLGAAAALIGPALVQEDAQGAGLALGLLVVAALALAAHAVEDRVLRWAALAGAGWYLPQAVARIWDDELGPVLLVFAAGVTLVATTVVLIRRARPGAAAG